MVEFLDKGRAGMASTFLVRMKVGADPRRRQGREPALPQLGSHECDLVWMILAAVFTLVVALMLSEPVRLVLRAFWRSTLLGLMINFRYHIVSLIAVFLALGIGLVLGTTFLDDATIDGLERQLDGLENDLDRGPGAATTSSRASSRPTARRPISSASRPASASTPASSVASPCWSCRPVAIDGEWVDGVMSSLVQADADVARHRGG